MISGTKKAVVLLLIGVMATLECCNATRSPNVAARGSRKLQPKASSEGHERDRVFGTATAFGRGGDISKIPIKAIYAVIALAAIEGGLKRIFNAANIKFPSQLGGCMVLFAVSVLAQIIHPGWGDSIQSFLEPGSALLNKWMPCFFVPGLAMFPLAPSIGSRTEIAKSFGVVALGLVYSLFTVTFSVLTIRKMGGVANVALVAETTPTKKVFKRNSKNSATMPVLKSFSPETLKFLSTGSVVLYVACVAAVRMNVGSIATPLQTLAIIFSGLAGFVWAARMPSKITKVVHPLITSSAVTVLIVQLIALGVGSEMKEVLRSYKTGTMNPLTMGAGDVLLWMLNPAVVSFAVAMYSRKQLIYENFVTIFAAMIVSSAGGLFGTAAFVRAISLGGSDGALVRLSIVARNVTTALSMAIAAILGGDISIAAVFVVLTGVLGATYGKALMNLAGIHDPVTRGLGMGCASQGLGVAAISNEPDAFPFAAIGMILTAVSATTLVSIPVTREAIINIATGGIPAAPVP